MTTQNTPTLHPETLAVRAGQKPDPTTGASQTPIYQSASFVFDSAEHAARLFALEEFGNIYSRLTNPTVGALQERVAALEGGVGAVATASGHAAQLLTLFNLLQAGDNIVASGKLYGGTVTQFSKSFKQFGWDATFADLDNLESFKAAINEKTKAIYVESLSNPEGKVADLEALATIAHDAGIPLIVDNTIATPFLCKPIDWGADIVLESATKYLTGNGSTLGGVIVDAGRFDWAKSDKFPLLSAPDTSYHGLRFTERFGNLAFFVRAIAVGLRDLGACLSPFNAFLILNAIETLPLRIQRHSQSALTIARYLQQHPQVAHVSHPALQDDANHQLLQKYFPNGASGLFSIRLKGGYEAGKALVANTQLFLHLANIGDSRSLILHPASTSHSQLTDEQKQKAGVGPDVVRLSIGLEHPDDLIADLEQALAALPQTLSKAA